MVVRGHFGDDLSRRRYWLLIAAGCFYVILGIFIFLLSSIEAIYDYVTLDMYPSYLLSTTNGTDRCGEYS